jgi:hemoglobin
MAPADESDANDQVTLYELVGGRRWFEELVDRFYDGVADDPVLRPLYPEPDLRGARQRLCGFLVQYWGGPDDYSRARGHPRLRLRHQPYPIDPAARARWFAHMRAALAASGLPAEVEAVVLGYFEGASEAMINQPPDH